MNNNDINLPTFVPPSYRKMIPEWSIGRALMRSMTLEEDRRRFLIQREGEPEKAFSRRVEMAVLDNYYEPALRSYVNQLADYKINDPDEVITPYLDNIDMRGETLTSFLLQMLLNAMVVDGVIVCTDFDDRQKRPYLQSYPMDAITCPLVIWEGPIARIARVGVMFSYETSVGLFGSGVSTGVRIYYHRPARTETWIDLDGAWVKTEERIMRDAAGREMQELPISWFSTQGATPLQPEPSIWGSLARMNVLHFNKSSEIDMAETITNLPTPVRIGVDSEASPALYLGYNACIDLPLGADTKYLEPSGTSIASSNERQDRREKAMERLAQLFSSSDNISKTATEARLEAEANKRGLESIAKRLQSTFNGIFNSIAMFADPRTDGKYPGSLLINTTLAKQSPGPEDIRVVLDMFVSGVISLKEIRTHLQVAGILPQSISEEQQSRINTESQDEPEDEEDDDETEDEEDETEEEEES